jgi:hypothetical protein
MTQKVTTKNTKNEIIEAYEGLLNQLESKGKDRLEEEDRKNKIATVEKVSKQKTPDIIHKIADLKLSVTEILENLGKNLVNEQEKLNNLQSAILFEESRLKELYSIVANANSLEALMLAQKKQKEDFENFVKIERIQFDEEITQKRLKWDKEKQDYEILEKERLDQREKKRKREEEEYEYQKKLKEQKDKDQYELKKANLEKELESKKKTIEEALSIRENEIVAREQELKDLREAKKNFDTYLQEKILETKNQLTKELEQKFKFESTLKSKETEGEISLLKQSISSLEEKLKEKQKIIDDINKQLILSQTQSQDLAKKVIDGSVQRKYYNLEQNNLKDTKNNKE